MGKGLFLGLMMIMAIHTKILVMDVQDLRKIEKKGDFRKLEELVKLKRPLNGKPGICYSNYYGMWLGYINPTTSECIKGSCVNMSYTQWVNKEKTVKCYSYSLERL